MCRSSTQVIRGLRSYRAWDGLGWREERIQFVGQSNHDGVTTEEFFAALCSRAQVDHKWSRSPQTLGECTLHVHQLGLQQAVLLALLINVLSLQSQHFLFTWGTNT
jgi:hypothetical protein